MRLTQCAIHHQSSLLPAQSQTSACSPPHKSHKQALNTRFATTAVGLTSPSASRPTIYQSHRRVLRKDLAMTLTKAQTMSTAILIKIKSISRKRTIRDPKLTITVTSTLNSNLTAGVGLAQVNESISVVGASQKMSSTHAIRLSLMTTSSQYSKCRTDQACTTSWRANPFLMSTSKELTGQISPTNYGLATPSHGPLNVKEMAGQRKRQ